MKENLILEACVETMEEAILAQQKGADRIELCGDLSQDGLTPSHELAEWCIQHLAIPVMVMIRPRGGNFVYTEEEILLMQNEIQYFKNTGAAGLVFGLLTPDNKIDVHNTQRLLNLAFPMQVTFHKAIDSTTNLLSSLELLNKMKGITRVLTSGGMDTAWNGRNVLKQMNELAEKHISIIAAGKVTPENFREIAHFTGVRELHGKNIV
ncbi:MAG TPA: copper homeostasis protein CutC [Prolixibacteraceae bacterium]|jgi:copper homeostasis protein|nr:copper homeostasis protein CutC [Prolixibacteraceae bacterium]